MIIIWPEILFVDNGMLLVAKDRQIALVIIVCSNYVMILIVFQFSNDNLKKCSNRFYHNGQNSIKGKMHKSEKIWWSFHEV